MVNQAEAISGAAASRARNSLLQGLVRIVGLSWLTGPIFDKELRVSSRRRRNYVLRFLYVTFFMALLSLFWLDIVAHRTTSLYQISRMAEAGRNIIMVVVWFQFLTSQAVAIVMLSTSISDEIYKRTLGVLMTTPIGSLQIVLGKLLSKLLQMVLLLAITLPLLAIVRVFGGVPWDFLVASLCVTMTTILFVGSLSLFFSIFTRRAYVVIIVTALTLAIVFALFPFIVAFLMHDVIVPGAFFDLLTYVNPYVLMVKATAAMIIGAIDAICQLADPQRDHVGGLGVAAAALDDSCPQGRLAAGGGAERTLVAPRQRRWRTPPEPDASAAWWARPCCGRSGGRLFWADANWA